MPVRDQFTRATAFGQENNVRMPIASKLFGAWRTRVAGWRQNARTRAALARLSDRDLADIGITRADAEFEISKRFWH